MVSSRVKVRVRDEVRDKDKDKDKDKVKVSRLAAEATPMVVAGNAMAGNWQGEGLGAISGNSDRAHSVSRALTRRRPRTVRLLLRPSRPTAI